MSGELEPCPFCGSDDVAYHNGWMFGNRQKHIVKTREEKSFREPSITCGDCGIGFSKGSYGWGITDEQAEADTKTAWNTRSSPTKHTLSIPPTGPVTENDIIAIIAERDRVAPEYKYATFGDWLSDPDGDIPVSDIGEAMEIIFNAAREVK